MAPNFPPRVATNNSLSQLETNIESLDVKISQANTQLAPLLQRRAQLRPGPGRNAVDAKAKKILERRKRLEAQRDQLEQQSFNMEQADMMTTNLRNVATTVDAMKTTNKTLRQQYGKLDVDKIERMQDEMADLLEVGNEIQESLGRAYDVPEEVDEAELDAELEALGDEVQMDPLGAGGLGAGAEMPGFLRDEVPSFVDEPPQQGKVKEAAG